MAIKQVTCSICKATVNKARTYHVGDGQRACKAHEGVQETKAALESQKQEKAAQGRQHDRQKASAPARGGSGSWSGDHGLKCWVCMNPGVRQDQFFLKVLVEMEKLKKIHGGFPNIFDPKHAIRLDKRCIFLIPKEKATPAMKYVREDFEQIVQMSGGSLAICGLCCQLCKIEPLPPVNMDQLAASSAMYSAFLEPVLSAAAGRQLARDN